MPTDLRSITDFDDLLKYLGNELDWPVEDYGFDELTFEYDADELGLKEEEAERLKDGSIRQLRPMPGGQPFGIFFVEFGQAKLPVVVLRRILNALVIKKRNSANPADRQRWDAADLLFISAFGEDEDREIAFAHFHKDPDTSELPVLRVLGWDGADTTLKTRYVADTLKSRLHWPEDSDDHDAWRIQWRAAFRHRLGHVIKTASDLADALARFASKIRDAAITIMVLESEAKGQLRKLHRAFQSALINDLSEKDFADTYAQTVTYGLLTAAISRTEMSEGRHGTALTQEDITAMVPVTNPFLKEMLQEFLKVGGRKGGVDFDELGINEVVELLRGDETDVPAILRDFGNRKPGEDPVIHFYENFLAAYNKQLRIQRGVFYTPQHVVGYIVRSVHELLQTEFGLEDGLASTVTWGEMLEKQPDLKIPLLTNETGCKDNISLDEHFVQILDPATGTATFLVEVIDVIYRHLGEKWTKEGLSVAEQGHMWNEYVPNHLLPRLHGYELMMAPYAIAHMKVGLKLAETGYRFGTEERARIYLTNALEPWLKQLPLIGFEALAHEAEAVNEIKRYRRFTVVIGNPPYSIQSQNLNDTARAWVDAYRTVDGVQIVERNALQFEKNIQDDYIKFIRTSQVAVNMAGNGIVGMVTNHGFIDGATFRGMRWSLLQSFSKLLVLDLHGNSNKKETAPDGSKDENVFDISQGVAVSLFVNTQMQASTRSVNIADLWGARSGKYRWLTEHSCQDTSWNEAAPSEPLFLFKESGGELQLEYEGYYSLADMMPLYSMGIKSSRDDLVLDFDSAPVLDRIERFRSAPISDEKICEQLGVPLKKGWNVSKARRDLSALKQLAPYMSSFLYRPLDWRLLFYHRAVVFSAAYPVMKHLLSGTNLAFVATRQTKDQWDVQCSRALVGHKSLGAYDANSVFPLYLVEDEGESQQMIINDPRINISPAFLRSLASVFNLKQTGSHGLPEGLTPEDIFQYAYAVFHSPCYRSRYAEFLKIDFPRMPLTGKLELFSELSQLGGELTALHLLESPNLDKPVTEFFGDNRQVSKVIYTPEDGGTVWLDGKGSAKKPQPGTSGFRPVSEEVWNFYIGGYQVCEKWLKDRQAKGGKNPRPGRTLTDDDITHYHKIVIALTGTIRLMVEIDEVIEAHGGWPDAFQTENVKEG